MTFSALLHQTFIAKRAQKFWRPLLLALLVAISYLALSPAPPQSVGSSWDKLNHTMAFASLAFCGFWSFSTWRARCLGLPLALLAYGGAIELLQLQIPQRDGEWVDLLADGLGIAIGLGLAATLLALKKD